jgi:hypothetical protein
VKTLTDPGAASVDYSAHNTTVAALRAVHRPNFTIGTSTPRLPNEEHTTYRVHARLVKAKLEDDGDIHLVIRGLSTADTMVTEMPNASCDGAASSAKRASMAKARNAFVVACGMPTSSHFKLLTGTATVRGVGFFDKPHTSAGQAPNFLELHPLLGFVGTCS